MLLFRQVTAFR